MLSSVPVEIQIPFEEKSQNGLGKKKTVQPNLRNSHYEVTKKQACVIIILFASTVLLGFCFLFFLGSSHAVYALVQTA